MSHLIKQSCYGLNRDKHQVIHCLTFCFSTAKTKNGSIYKLLPSWD